MANATITVPSGTQNGNFNAMVTFATPVSDFTAEKVTLTTVTGNGINGVTFEVIGEGSAYNLSVVLPEDVEGSLRITISGLVTPENGSSPEGVMANTPIIVYNNISFLTATVGMPVYYPNGEIGVAVTFEKTVLYFSKTDFSFQRLTGDRIDDFDYYLLGGGSVYELRIRPSPQRAGSLILDITGNVYVETEFLNDDIRITPVLVQYQTKTPVLVDYDSPGELYPGTWDIFLEFDIPAIGMGITNFIYKGQYPSTPVLYRAVPLDVIPPRPGVPRDSENPPDCVGEWILDTTGDSVVPARFFLLRFNVPEGISGELVVTPIIEYIRGVMLG